MKNLVAAVFTFVPTFAETYGDASRAARAAREGAMDRLMAAAFTEIERGHMNDGEPVSAEYIDVTLGASIELSGILMMMAQDRITLMHHESFVGVHDSVEDIVLDLLEEARGYLDPEMPVPQPAPDIRAVEAGPWDAPAT